MGFTHATRSLLLQYPDTRAVGWDCGQPYSTQPAVANLDWIILAYAGYASGSGIPLLYR